MLRVFRSKKWLVGIVGVAIGGTLATVALATPGFLFAGDTPLVTGSMAASFKFNSDQVKLQTKDPTDVRVQKIVIGASGYSGWHHHPGVVIVAVATGAVTLMQSDCTSTTYGPGLEAGSTFVEGGDNTVQASSTAGATVFATYIAPHASPPVFRVDDPAPACAAP